MHLVSFSAAGSNAPRPGILLQQSGTVIDLAAAYDDTLAVIAADITAIDTPAAHSSHKLSEVRLHAPLSNPPRIFAIGLNYRDHAAETKMALPSAPVVFFKLPTASATKTQSSCPKTPVSRTTRPNSPSSSARVAIAFRQRRGVSTSTVSPSSTT